MAVADIAAGPGRVRVQPGQTRLPSLTGLRFVAAALVFGFHAYVVHLVDTGSAGRLLGWIFGPGSAGVTFFFILSGFVLSWSARESDTAPRFWQRRFARIYPSHVVMLAVAVALLMISGKAVTVLQLAANVLLIQPWFQNPDVYFGLNTVSWSLACEAFFYLLFPVFYRGIRAIPARWLRWAAAGALGLVWLVPLVTLLLPESDRYWVIWLFPVARTPEFVTGMLLARVVREKLWPTTAVGPVMAVAGLGYLASNLLPMELQHVAWPAIFFAAVIATAGAADAEGRTGVWGSRWAVWLGEISFAFYLVHLIVLRIVLKATGFERPLWQEALIVLVCLALAVVASWLLHRSVELPGMRWLSPRSRRTTDRSGQPPMAGLPTTADRLPR
ncbi:acyltransferase [Hamadaea sp. NPDC051192]|uniref:acyltransferase family protein n=1 Tax=Hamadaea sp. NPDC051192 TaxID=3154940 RepID=UPI003448DBAA